MLIGPDHILIRPNDILHMALTGRRRIEAPACTRITVAVTRRDTE